MRIPRIYHPEKIQQSAVELSEDATNHVARVLRMRQGEQVILFSGDNCEHLAKIASVSKNAVSVIIEASAEKSLESPLNIHLGQVISRGDKMDFTLQKSVELGVDEITPLFSERCGVKLGKERLDKKIQQWQKIVIGACEQSGRNTVPKVNPAMQISDWCQQKTMALNLTLHPKAKSTFSQLQVPAQGVRLLIGPEGGLTNEEITMTRDLGFQEVLVGPRVLRTETAALTAISVLQSLFGDLA